MAEYHIGNGFENIYAGTLSKDKRRWANKSDVIIAELEQRLEEYENMIERITMLVDQYEFK